MLGQVNRYLLQVAFAFFPPPCPTYLLTDEHPSIEAPCGTLAQTGAVSGCVNAQSGSFRLRTSDCHQKKLVLAHACSWHVDCQFLSIQFLLLLLIPCIVVSMLCSIIPI